jgi:hypothetical protein
MMHTSMRNLMTCTAGALFIMAFASQGVQAAREDVERTERDANARIGKLPPEVLDVPGVQCEARGSENGCLHEDSRDCRIWYAVDPATGLIARWRYEGVKENCSKPLAGR